MEKQSPSIVQEKKSRFQNNLKPIIISTAGAIALSACSIQNKCQTNYNKDRNAGALACSIAQNDKRIKKQDGTQKRVIDKVQVVGNITESAPDKRTEEKPLVTSQGVSGALVYSKTIQEQKKDKSLEQGSFQARAGAAKSRKFGGINDSESDGVLFAVGLNKAYREAKTGFIKRSIGLNTLVIKNAQGLSGRLTLLYKWANKVLNPNADTQSSRENKKTGE